LWLRTTMTVFNSPVGYQLSSSGPATHPAKVGSLVRLKVGRLARLVQRKNASLVRMRHRGQYPSRAL
jgi:hypothetical protein